MQLFDDTGQSIDDTVQVRRCGFTPVKGCAHTSRSSVELSAAGPVGDRRFCLVDLDRSRVLRTVQHPALVPVRTDWSDGVLTVDVPAGDQVRAPTRDTGEELVVDYWGRPTPVHLQRGPHAGLFSDLLDRPVLLARAEPAAVVWADPVSILSTGALTRLGARVERLGAVVPPDLEQRFRATLTLDTEEDPAPGSRWRLGGAVLQVVNPLERCAVVDIDPGTGTSRGGLLRVLPHDDAGRPVLGVTARVLRPGTVRVGDPVGPAG